MTIYLDYNATTPIDPRVEEVIGASFVDEIIFTGGGSEGNNWAIQVHHTFQQRNRNHSAHH